MQTKNLPHKTEERPMIYQVIPRLFTNMQPECTRFGTLDQNGSGKFDDYTPGSLNPSRIWELPISGIPE